MKLAEGDRCRLEDANAFVVVKTGKVEVYAATHKELSFRQIYLGEIGAGCAAFPSMDEFELIDIVLYAVGDAEIEECTVDSVSSNELASFMREWFQMLIRLPWLRLMADRGDEVLLSWLNGSVLSGKDTDIPTLLKAFADNESIFSALLGVRFWSEDNKLAERIDIREKQKQRIVDATVGTLLGEENLSKDDEYTGNVKLEEAAYIVRLAAKALSMPSSNVHLAPEMVKRLDQLALIYRLAGKCGMNLRLVKLEKDWYTGDSGVLIGYYGDNKELAALVPEPATGYKLVTQSNSRGIPVTEEIADRIDKDAFLCYAGLPSRQLGILDFLKFCLRQSKEWDWRTIILASMVAGLIPLVTPIITETMFQDIIPILDRKGLATIAQVAIVTGFTTATLQVVRSIALLRFSVHIDMSGEAALLGRILTLPTHFFRKFQSGDLASRLQGMTQIQMLLVGEMVPLVLNFLFAFWSILLMCWYSLKLTAVAIVIWAVYVGVMAWLLKRLTFFQRNMTTAKNKTAGILGQIFTGLAKFRMRGAESEAYRLWGEQFANEWQWNYAARQQKNHTTILTAVQPILLSLALYYIVYKDIAEAMADGKTEGIITSAVFIAFQTAYTAFNVAMRDAIPAVEELSVIRPLIENIKPILEEEPEVSEDKIESEVLTGAIEVRHLTFSYSKDAPNVISDMSFNIAAGEHVAIVGKSGCGKSTLIRLLLGFEKPKSGAVYYDNQDLSELSIPSVRNQLGVVLQGGQLMAGDIFHNIVGTANLTIEDAWEAAKAAGIDEDIRQMPMQMHTMISEGSTNISGGQRQRILIARALAMKPSIVIFDEATSALDNRTQAIVTKSLDCMKATRLVVAHRLSTIRNADRIIVLDGGHIAESGTFDELLEKDGLFASFVKRQVA
ncbi:MAG: NHLP bacteriocin export ABC transporter permease/ATPase subunit [Selenomonadaceae bacterium]|nr:NHLP bacteriocin export ABC transporter permease/ATPase subunit [Selenomonadaceae bacterium]